MNNDVETNVVLFSIMFCIISKERFSSAEVQKSITENITSKNKTYETKLVIKCYKNK